MKLSELIARYGDEKVVFQRLDDCAVQFTSTSRPRGTRCSFVTPEPFGPDGFAKVGLVVWMDRERVKAIIAELRAEEDAG